jgi:hypothetical protein
MSAGPPPRDQSARERAPSAKAIANAQLYAYCPPATAEDDLYSLQGEADFQFKTPEDSGSFFVTSFGPNPKTWDEAMASPYANEWIAAKIN